ncbi:MAG: phenylalanine--tRNA ligase subunit beta [Verrucomicrobiota bacterium]|nr:phenylalanine--tRNA ligase subunit beta [Verrucomicrobiota bacterium]
MNVPLSWLKDYVDVDAPPEELARRLTFSGTEVAAIRTVGSSFDGIVVAEIVETAPHPDADDLLVCRVKDGRRVVRVVCGARNFAVGDKAPFAPAGCRLPGGRAIGATEIRGVESEGMLCAEDELGLSDDHSGLLLLPRETPAGAPLAEALGPPETVLDVEVTWNRPDCLSIIGIAREVAALFGGKVKLPSVVFREDGRPVEELAKVTLEDAQGCLRYTARVLWDVKQAPAPLWMRRRLSLCGARAINNIVDITNYVLIECGQPLHAFDYDLLADHHIIVRRARPGETMATLDGAPRCLTPDMTLIADPRKAVAVGGVMGGAGSGIRPATTRVLLEAATFDPLRLHRASLALALSTESSYRYERGVDVARVEWCSRRAAALMTELAGATAARGVIDAYPNPQAERAIRCRYGRVRALYGVETPDDRVVSILESLDLPVVSRDAESCVVLAPSFRPDLEIEADLIEEVVRVNGLDKAPTLTPSALVAPDASDAPAQALIRCRSNLVGLGLTEIMNYSFLPAELLDRFTPGETARRVALPNPVSADYAVMRDSLIPQMADTLGRNRFRQVEHAAFFETGRVFLRDDSGVIHEEERLALGLMGAPGRTALDARKPAQAQESFLWLKGILEQIARVQRVNDLAFAPFEHPALELGRTVAVIVGEAPAGVAGLLRASLGAEYRMNGPVAIAEMSLAPLLARAFGAPELKPVPAFPSVTRDVALVAPANLTNEAIARVIRRHAPPELTSVELFDIFSGEGIRKGYRSLAYSLVYCSAERTLTDEDASRYHAVVKNALTSELGVEIRDK